jgi:predicted transposase/invertase (TIGR01784 family)
MKPPAKEECERARIRSRKKFLMDETSSMITAKKFVEKGRAEGIAVGQLNERRKNVEHMYREGFSVAQIAKGLDIPEKEVNALYAYHN